MSKNSGRDGLTASEEAAESIIEWLEQLCVMALTLVHDCSPDDNKELKVIFSGYIKYLADWFSTVAKARPLETDDLMFASRTDLGVPSWLYFHSAFHSLDLCRFTLATINYLEDHEKFLAGFEPDFMSKDVSNLKDNVRKLCTNVRQHAAEQRKRLQKPDTVQKMLEVILCQPIEPEDPVGKELQKLVDESWLDEIIDKLRTSWVEAINGIGDVKVF